MIKKIDTNGIFSLEAMHGSRVWYWGSDYASGDLYEAEELYQDHHPVSCNRLVLVHYPDGRVVEPIRGEPGQYFGRPIFHQGGIQILTVDFPRGTIGVFRYDDHEGRVSPVVSLPLSEVKDCYNLQLHREPLMLTRQGSGGDVQIIWPEKADFALGEHESFFLRRGDRLYCSRWAEDADGRNYREEIVIRSCPGGEILEVIPGAWMEMPDGQIWALQ